jgi:hypothetical protein
MGVLRVRPEEMRMEKTTKQIAVYICPTPDCGNYYGTSLMPDLTKEFSGVKLDDAGSLEAKGQSRYKQSRAECPDCRACGRGRIVRVLTRVNVAIPVIGPEAPELPAPNPTTRLAGATSPA